MAYTIIDKSDDYFETKLYTGNGGTLNVTGLDFAPNWVWIKSRSSSRVHCLFDTVRGATKRLQTNEGDTEYTTSNSLTGFNSDGFSLGSYNQSNEGSANFVSWNWKAGTAVSGTTSGSGTGKAYSGSVNTDAGFSIIKYLGNGSAGHTIPHHLGAVVKMIILKRVDASSNWSTYHVGMGNGKSLPINESEAPTTATSFWNDTTPTSSVFTVGSISNTNSNNSSIIAYSFADVKGYSKFGSYTGNGSTNGTFVYTGFKPAWVLVKKISGSAQWQILDNKRDAYNPAITALFPDSSDADTTSYNTDFLSNGFKLRATTGSRNGSGSTYIYMAFAENPFVTSTGIPGLAR